MLALLCGGQGRISESMFDLTADQPEASAIFKAASALLSRDPRHLVRDASEDVLLVNRTSQLLTVTATLAVHACIDAMLRNEFVVTGYSVGEMAAWVIADAWTAETALHLTDVRARAMDVAGGTGGRLGYVRGLARSAVEALAHRRNCEIAITNPDNLTLIGGAEADVAAVCREAVESGAQRADLLPIRIASHTAFLKSAAVPFQAALATADIHGPARSRILLAGSDGARIFSAADAAPKLASQVATSINWAGTLEALTEYNVDRVLDLGPGHALADMMATTFPEVASYSIDAFRSADGIRRWIALQ